MAAIYNYDRTMTVYYEVEGISFFYEKYIYNSRKPCIKRKYRKQIDQNFTLNLYKCKSNTAIAAYLYMNLFGNIRADNPLFP